MKPFYDSASLQNAKISVIIPAYNAEKTLEAAMQSCIDQTFLPFEVIIINDGSTDKTEETANNFIKKQQTNVKFSVISVKNGGVSRARNIGIKQAAGDFVAFLDSDDAWHTEKLAKQIEAFKNFPNTALVSTNSTVKNHFSGQTRRVSFTHLLIRNHVITSSAIVPAAIIKNCMFDQTLRRAEDYNLWLKLGKIGKIVFIDQKLVFFADKRTFGASGLSANFHALTADEIKGHTKLFFAGTINFGQYFFALGMTCVKYLRKCIIYYLT